MTPATPPPSSRPGELRPGESASAGSAERRQAARSSPARRPYQASWQVARATPADHVAIRRFLVSFTQQPSAAEFQAQLDNPFYEPSDRLLLKLGSQIVAHVRLAAAEIRFGEHVVPVAWVEDLATQPEYRHHGCASTLLAQATEQMQQNGQLLGLLRTDLPRFYAARGWVVCGRHSYSAAAPRAILSHLTARSAEQQQRLPAVPTAGRRKEYVIRLWRHVEQEALSRLYQQLDTPRYGAPLRSDAYWRWLIGRRGYDRIYVAIDGSDKSSLEEQVASIVGYAVMKQGRIVELMHAAEREDAAHQLLARACGDAIEHDVHRIQLDGPPSHPLHAVFTRSGGAYHWHEADRGQVFMARLIKPRRLLKVVGKTLYVRARDAGLPSGCELGLMLESSRLRLKVTRQGAQLLSGKLGRSYLQCTAYQLTQLLLGHLNLADAIDQCRIRASTRVAQQTAAALFPQLPWWLPPWDFLPAP